MFLCRASKLVDNSMIYSQAMQRPLDRLSHLNFTTSHHVYITLHLPFTLVIRPFTSLWP